MPTYDYECTKCRHSFSVEQSMSDKPLRKCPRCGGKLEKLLPQTLNLIFKGSGFYVTDYKNKGKGQPDRKSRQKPASRKEGQDSGSKSDD